MGTELAKDTSKTKPKVANKATAQPRGTLLVVDDEEGSRQALEMIFKDDYNLLLAADGPSAIQLAQKNHIDVAILDIRMSGMSGIEVLERLRYIDPSIEVIMITAYETTDTLRQALRLRASDYINKPFDVATIRNAVADAMSRRLLTREIHGNTKEMQELLNEFQNLKIAEQLSRIRGDIYASIFHDVKNSLTVISGFSQLISQRLSEAAPLTPDDLEWIKKHLRTINRQVQSCIELSRRYLAYLSKQTEETPRASINQVLSDLQDFVKYHPSVGENEFELKPLAQDNTVLMSGTDLLQVLLNLAVNAFQCDTKKHKVEVEARMIPHPLDLRQFKDTTEERILNLEGFDNTAPILAVAVRDNGPGIKPDILPQIFNPYFTTKSGNKGTGLGLSIVLRLIKRAKGALHLQTKVGLGTTVTVYLPARYGTSPSTSADQQPRAE
ncbi:MAG: response regulator [Verrucomicrobiae bacterium]|nr:response regulator [Verrucomicrobiae bacterium]